MTSESKAVLEEDMKQAFMRSVCALNIEAIAVMNRNTIQNNNDNNGNNNDNKDHDDNDENLEEDKENKDDEAINKKDDDDDDDDDDDHDDDDDQKNGDDSSIEAPRQVDSELRPIPQEQIKTNDNDNNTNIVNKVITAATFYKGSTVK